MPPPKNIYIYIVKQHNQHKITEMKAIGFGFKAIDGRLTMLSSKTFQILITRTVGENITVTSRIHMRLG